MAASICHCRPLAGCVTRICGRGVAGKKLEGQADRLACKHLAGGKIGLADFL